MSDLVFHHFQTGLAPEVLAAFETALKQEGITDGVFCIGPAPIDQSSIFMMWAHLNDLRAISTVPRIAFDSAATAGIVARQFAAEHMANRARAFVGA